MPGTTQMCAQNNKFRCTFIHYQFFTFNNGHIHVGYIALSNANNAVVTPK